MYFSVTSLSKVHILNVFRLGRKYDGSTRLVCYSCTRVITRGCHLVKNTSPWIVIWYRRRGLWVFMDHAKELCNKGISVKGHMFVDDQKLTVSDVVVKNHPNAPGCIKRITYCTNVLNGNKQYRIQTKETSACQEISVYSQNTRGLRTKTNDFRTNIWFWHVAYYRDV